MIEKKIEILIIKYYSNQLNSEEIEKLNIWLEDDNNKILFQQYFVLNYNIELAKWSENKDREKGWIEIQNQINPPRRMIPYWKYAVAASLALIMSISFLYNKSNEQIIVTLPKQIIDNNIDIGNDKAILTLEDGTNISLEKGKQFSTANVTSNGEEIVYSKNTETKSKVEYNYLTIPRGGQFKIQLLDGTIVWLNSESKLKYPVAFVDGESRKVELIYGEAYFDVSPSTNHAGAIFIVDTQAQEIEVLGTEFNVKAYQDEDYIYTTLVEGKVEINKGSNNALLNPGDQAIINISSDNNDIDIVKVDIYEETSWKNGMFSFKNKPLKEIAKVLSRWYDVEIIISTEELEKVQFKGVLNKNQNIEEILLIIKNTNFINSYNIENNTIIIK